MDTQLQKRIEQLGPAERIITTLTSFADHVVHNRPGIVVKDETSALKVAWSPVIWIQEGDKKVVYKSVKVGRKIERVKVGAMNGDLKVKDGRTTVGEYRKPGLFTEAVEFYYRQAAEIWKLDNEFAAKWASWSFERDHRDMKTILAALMLVQNRWGAPVMEDGKVLLYDEDYRDVGEAMCLIRAKLDLNPKLLLRVGDILSLPEVAAINHKLGFNISAREPALGRYHKVVTKWLQYREGNLPMLEGLVKAGFRTTVMALAQRVGYKPLTPKFFEILRWKQQQAKDGRRTIAIGAKVRKAESWVGKSEQEICETIVAKKMDWKRVAGLLPKEVGMTRAIVAAAVEAGSMSDQDLIIMTPTLEELGLLKVPSVEQRWKAALAKAENQRAAHIARNVKTKEAKEGLQEAVDKATEKVMEKATRNLRVYVIIDKSGSMEGALERAKTYLTRFLGGFPLDRTHVAVFNTVGTEVKIQAPKAAAVEQAFKGHMAGGGTTYSEGVRVLVDKYKPTPEEDALMIFVGDEGESSHNGTQLMVNTLERANVHPVAFGLLKIRGTENGSVVTDTAAQLGIPCFPVDEKMFTANDPYVITRLLGDLIAATPVGKARVGHVAPVRKTLVEEILGTELLKKPVWA
jgi:Mg-chelatase subunit ChlD